MRPGDHPEFYRLAPPDGRSRESTLVLDREGRFWHDGQLVEHEAMAHAFARWIGRHPDDGRYILDNGYDWTYLTVEEVPLFVRAVRRGPQGQPLLALSDGAEVELEPSTLWEGPDHALYTEIVRGSSGKFTSVPARFTPYAQTQLADWLVEGPDGTVRVQVLDGHVHGVPHGGGN